MACAPDQSDRNFSADTLSNTGDGKSLARLLEQSEVLEVFDEAIRLRFGKVISTAALKPLRRHRRDRAA